MITLADLADKVPSSIAGDDWPALRKFGITNVAQLVTHLPLNRPGSYTPTAYTKLVAGDPTPRLVVGRLVGHWGRGVAVGAKIRDPHGHEVSVYWFGQTWRMWTLQDGDYVRMIGCPSMSDPRRFEMPLAFETSPTEGTLIYPAGLSKKLTSDRVRQHILAALDVWQRQGVTDLMTGGFCQRNDLDDRLTAYRNIHNAPNEAAFERARQRLAFDELVRIQITLARGRHRRSVRVDGFDHSGPAADLAVQRFAASRPWPLTGAQQRAIDTISELMSKPAPMNHLLQGDVGAGKTVVAGAAVVRAVSAGSQVAVLAPTQVLADQLHTEMSKALDGTVTCERFPSKAGKQRTMMLARIASGETHVVVGTTALLEPTVAFHRLGLVVVDEQHRFGVAQRETLRQRLAEAMPDMLSMTATPIPRTAAIIAVGDATTSILDEKPTGRAPTTTRWATEADEVWPHIRAQVAVGRQAFVVCPLVDDNPDTMSNAQSAIDLHLRLSAGEFAGLRVGLLHGQLKPAEKTAVMDSMRAGKIDVLVSTTVIEVGVDVPNATVIAIYADRFGIAQLHQLRGRVGRGGGESWCWLIAKPILGPGGATLCPPRVRALCDSDDGFVLAEQDWKMRGSGTIFAEAQHGASDLQATDLHRDGRLVELAQATATKLIGDDPELADRPAVAAEVNVFVPDEIVGRLSAA